jgi:hypothetical protein
MIDGETWGRAKRWAYRSQALCARLHGPQALETRRSLGFNREAEGAAADIGASKVGLEPAAASCPLVVIVALAIFPFWSFVVVPPLSRVRARYGLAVLWVLLK